MKYIIKLLLSCLIVYLLAHVLPFVTIFNAHGVLLFVLLISILNVILKPVLIIFTIPITIFTLGLFLLVINGIIISVADYFIKGIDISNGIIGAIIFSVFLSIGNYVVEKLVRED